MKPRYHARVHPGPSLDWHDLPIVGAGRRAPRRGRIWFVVGVIVGILVAALAR